MLNERAQILLKTLVERYVAEGQPVGSRTLSRYSGLDLSPASIRNVMADLEEMGFVASPHTSAGRVPTPLGYRFFVDCLLTVRSLDRFEIDQLEGQLHGGQPQKLLQSASHLLSDLTRGRRISTVPALIVNRRGLPCPLRYPGCSMQLRLRSLFCRPNHSVTSSSSKSCRCSRIFSRANSSNR